MLIKLATKEDREYHIDYWARLFKATTWEEISMLAVKDECLQEAANTIFKLNADEQIRKQCRDREEYYQDLHNYEKTIARMDAAIMEKDAAITEKDALLQKAATETERLRALLREHGIDEPKE